MTYGIGGARFHRAMRAPRSRAAQVGFTLVEIMIVVLIIGVLAGIAYASYQNLMIKSRRGTAATCLQERAQFMERLYSTRMSYAVAPEAPATPQQCDPAVSRFYTISYASRSATAYTLNATPIGIQLAKDTKCGTLSLTHQGVRGKSGTAASAAECW